MRDPVVRTGETLAGRYRTEATLGEGGTSFVYRAYDVRYERPVVVKVLKTELAASVGAKRFLAEIRTTAQLQHPNILPLLDSGEFGGSLFYVMPYLEGETLASRLERDGALPIAEALHVTAGVGQAISYAHRMGILHRDIKPQNILLCADVSMVMDFGIALALRNSGSNRLTDGGLAIGTPQYMSPEQTTGERELDGRSDLYSLACVLYEMLAGEPPHLGSSRSAVVAKRLTVPPVPVRVLRPEVPQQVDDALRRALSSARVERFDSVEEFIACLLVEGRRPDPRAQRAPHPVRRNEPEKSVGVVVLPVSNVSQDDANDYVCSGLAMEIIHALERVHGLKVIAPDSSRISPQPNESIRELVGALGVTHALEGTARFAGNRYRVDMRLIDGESERRIWEERFDGILVSDDLFDLQDSVARAVVHALAGTMHLPAPPGERPGAKAYDHYLRGRHAWYRRAIPDLFEAVAHLERVVVLAPEYVRAYTALADAYNVLGGADYATHPPGHLYPKACAAAQRALELDPHFAEAHAAMGNYLMSYAWDWEAAGISLERCLELDDRYSIGRQWYSNYLQYTGRGDEAVDHARRALTDDPRSVFLHSSLARHYMFLRDYDRAIEKFEDAVDLDPTFFGARIGCALTQVLAGRAEQGAVALEHISRRLGREPPLLKAARAYTLGVLDDEGGARALLEELRRVRDAWVAPPNGPLESSDPPYVPSEFVALAHVGLHQTEQALDELERALAARSQIMSQLAVEPLLDSLRSHPRFVAMLGAVGLDKAVA